MTHPGVETEPLTALLPDDLLRQLEAEARRRDMPAAELLVELLAETLPTALAEATAVVLKAAHPIDVVTKSAPGLRPRGTSTAVLRSPNTCRVPPVEAEGRAGGHGLG